MERSRGPCKERVWNRGVRMYRDIYNVVERRGGVLQIRSEYLARQGVEMVEAYWFLRDAGMRAHGYNVGPACFGISFAGRGGIFV